MKNNSWVVMVTGAGKTSRHVVEGNSRAEAVKNAEDRTGCRVTQAWPATGKYQSLHDGRVSSGMVIIKS